MGKDAQGCENTELKLKGGVAGEEVTRGVSQGEVLGSDVHRIVLRACVTV